MIASVVSATIAVLFGSATFAFACFTITTRIGSKGCMPSSTDGSIESTVRLLSHISKVGVVLALVYLIKSFSMNGTTGQDLDFILFSFGSLFAASFATIRPNQLRNEEENETENLLPRAQTDELKGIMQTLLYIGHFYENGDQSDPVRLLFVCTFLWLTGFCHASYYLNTSDYSIWRVTFVLLRMNLLAFLLTLASGKPGEFLSYPACSIHSIAYFMVYCIMKISSKGRGCNPKYQLRKLLLIVFGALCLSSVSFSSFLPSLLLPTLFGIIFAYNRSEIKQQFMNLDTGSGFRVVAKQLTILISMVCSTTGLILWSHAIVGRKWEPRPFLIISTPVAYLLCRNVNTSLRQRTLGLFGAIGSVSLELYVLHRHVYGMPNSFMETAFYPKVRILVTGAVCYCAARTAKTATNSIIGSLRWLLQSKQFLGQGLSTLALIFSLCLGLKVTALLTSVSISAMSGCFGYALYLRSTKSTPLHSTSRSRYGQAICLAATLLFGFVLKSFHQPQHNFQIDSNRLDKTCDKAILKGTWVSVNTCTDSVLYTARQNSAISSFGTCESLQWAWNASHSDSKCVFTHRKPESLHRSLSGQHVTFIGDSEIRHLFYAVCRSLGDFSAGAYNTTLEKHSDVTREYDHLVMDFRWAPFVQNLSAVLETEIATSSSNAIVMGGGAWDRLHHFESKEEQETLRNAVSNLANYLKSLDSPIVWVTPTTINTWALNSEQKRNNIREEQMQSFRELYKEAGIDSAVSFLFDGTSYTKDRVNECYDGVHYPFTVYDGGAQILANAFDWLLLEQSTASSPSKPLPPAFVFRALDSIEYLLLMITFCVGVYAFDNFCGSFYVASLVWSELSPHCVHADTRSEGRDPEKESDEENKDVFSEPNEWTRQEAKS